MIPAPEPAKAPPEAPLSRYRRMVNRLRELNTPNEVKPPNGLGFFIVIFVAMLLIAIFKGAFRELTQDKAIQQHDFDAMRTVFCAWLTMMGTINVFQPRKRWFGYCFLTMAMLIMILQFFNVHR